MEIPSVGKIPVRSDADGYNEEVQIAAQGAIAAGRYPAPLRLAGFGRS